MLFPIRDDGCRSFSNMAGKPDQVSRVLPGALETRRAFQSALMDWFRAEGRDYPWRNNADPYAVFVSEAMLQQTQIATVLGKGYFSRWMRAFPTWEALAAAEETEILKEWEGLGYYNRARNLQKAAKRVTEEFGGRLPEDLETILSLPGVGRYTAGAVLSFAFNRRAPIVDGNVVRVFSRLISYSEPVDTTGAARLFWGLADDLTPGDEPRIYNSAIMELGQRICLRSSPECGICPVQVWCLAHSQGAVEAIPQKKRRAETLLREERVLFSLREGRIFLCPETGSRRKGLWRLPEISGAASEDLVEVLRFDYPITRYRVTLIVFINEGASSSFEKEISEGGWFAAGEGEMLPPLGSPYRKVLRMMLLRGMI